MIIQPIGFSSMAINRGVKQGTMGSHIRDKNKSKITKNKIN